METVDKKQRTDKACAGPFAQLDRLLIISHVFSYLSKGALFCVMRTCKHMNELTHSPFLWANMLKRDYNFTKSSSFYADLPLYKTHVLLDRHARLINSELYRAMNPCKYDCDVNTIESQLIKMYMNMLGPSSVLNSILKYNISIKKKTLYKNVSIIYNICISGTSEDMLKILEANIIDATKHFDVSLGPAYVSYPLSLTGIALQYRNLGVIKALLKNGVVVDDTDLIEAACRDDGIIKCLIDARIATNHAINKDVYYGVLRMACVNVSGFNEHNDLIIYLVDLRMHAITENIGDVLMRHALVYSNNKLIPFLKNKIKYNTNIITESCVRELNINVKHIMDKSFNPNYISKSGMGFLELACKTQLGCNTHFKREAIIRLLLENKVDADGVFTTGENAKQYIRSHFYNKHKLRRLICLYASE